MNLQSRKLEAISFLINLQDERVFKKIETTIKESKEEQMAFAPLTQSEIIARAKKSNDDYVNGNTTDQEKLENESESW